MIVVWYYSRVIMRYDEQPEGVALTVRGATRTHDKLFKTESRFQKKQENRIRMLAGHHGSVITTIHITMTAIISSIDIMTSPGMMA